MRSVPRPMLQFFPKYSSRQERSLWKNPISPLGTSGERSEFYGVRPRTPERFGFSLSIARSGYDDPLGRSGGSACESPCFGFSLWVVRSEDAGRFVRAGGNVTEAQCFGRFLYDRAALPGCHLTSCIKKIAMACGLLRAGKPHLWEDWWSLNRGGSKAANR